MGLVINSEGKYKQKRSYLTPKEKYRKRWIKRKEKPPHPFFMDGEKLVELHLFYFTPSLN
jgi:hypothetical protein